MRSRILQILENYCSYLGGNENGDTVYGISEDEFDDVVNDIQDLIDGELSDDDINYSFIDSPSDPYDSCPKEVYLDEKPKTMPKKYSGMRYIRK